jgi:hypothetical protein
MASTNVLIAKHTISTGNVGTVTFDNIPQNFKHLRLAISARTDRGSTVDGIKLRFNGDTTTANYPEIRQYIIGTSLTTSTENMFAGYCPGSSIGSNVFSSSECLILDYTSSRAKSTNAWTHYASTNLNGFFSMDAGKYTGTSAISKIVLTPDVGPNFLRWSTFALYGVADTATAIVTKPKARGGDIVNRDTNYWYHAYLANGTFTLEQPAQVEALIVAGGGGGGGHYASDKPGAGGGAGGVVYRSLYVDKGTYAVTVGAGGAGGGSSANTAVATLGANGSNSSVFNLTAIGGGGGGGGFAGSGTDHSGSSGGSGGGGTKGATAASGTAEQGNDGAECDVGSSIGVDNGSGGGGAGYAGLIATVSVGGGGGIGTSGFTEWALATNTGYSTSLTYAGGGGGGHTNSSAAGAGGTGGGGAGGAVNNNGTSADNNTGSGGGGAGGGTSGRTGGAGGSGIVILRYSV